MKKVVLGFKSNRGEILYACTERCCTCTSHIERAKQFTLKKANQILEKHKEMQIMEIGE